jgi:hypothetical protein
MDRFADIVEAADRLTPADQLALVKILKHRLADQERREIVADVANGKSEFGRGGLESKSARSIMDEIRDES